jgi:hypothetical protein
VVESLFGTQETPEPIDHALNRDNSVVDITNNCFVVESNCDLLPKPRVSGTVEDETSTPDRGNRTPILKKPDNLRN